MSISVAIGLAAAFFVAGIWFIIKGVSSKEEHAVPISNPKEIEELKNSFAPPQQKNSSDSPGKISIDARTGPVNLLKEAGAIFSGGSKRQAEIDELIQKNEQLKQNLEVFDKENQQIKEAHLTKIRMLEEKVTEMGKEKEILLPHRQLIDELKAKGESFEKRCEEDRVQQKELRELVHALKLEKNEWLQSQKLGVSNSEFEALSGRLESSITTLETLKRENKGLQQANQDLKDDFGKIEEHNKRLLEKESIMEYELSKNRAQTLGLEKICEDFKAQIESLTAIASDQQ